MVKKRKRKVSKSRQRSRYKGILIKVSVLAIIIIAISYFYIDRQVQRILSFASSESQSAIYSAPWTIKSEQKISVEQLESALIQRNYTEVNTENLLPGQYKKSGTAYIIMPRNFSDAFGKDVKQIQVKFDPEARYIESNSKERSSFSLEPVNLSPLIGNQQKSVKSKRLEEIPKHVVDAVLAVEDQRFYSHFGLDPIGFARAMTVNLMALDFVQGGSTLSQQLAKNLLFSSKKTFLRKFQEALAALSLEYRLSKKQILELYINEVYLGQEGSTAIHGFGAASQSFFARDLSDISIAQSALLAGIIRAPSYYAPKRHLSRAQDRKAIALKLMLDQSRITSKDYELAIKEKIRIIDTNNSSRKAPFYVDRIRDYFEKDYSLESAKISGTKINTGMDFGMQICAEKAISEGLKKINPNTKLQAGLLAIEPFSGLIKAYVGGSDYSKTQYDHVSQARRHIGSTIKPFVYLTALDKSLNRYKVATADSIISDEPIEIKLENGQIWRPENYDKNYHGKVSLRYALEKSLNIPAAYVGNRVGIPAVVSTLKKFKVSSQIPAIPAITLGALDTNLFNLVAAYAALANGGIYVEPRWYVSAVDASGTIVGKQKIVEEQIANENAIYVLSNILQGVIERGTGSVIRTLGFKRNAAGKTGTSNDTRDSWFVGYTPSLVAGVWIGYDNNQSTGLTGATGAAPIWAEFMKCAESYYSDSSFIAPRGVTNVEIDLETGGIATNNCPAENVVREVYVVGTEPISSCHLHPGENKSASKNIDRNQTKTKGFWENLFGN